MRINLRQVHITYDQMKSQISNSESTNFYTKYHLIYFIFSTAKLEKFLETEIMVKKIVDSEF